jgi:hypothetical protein
VPEIMEGEAGKVGVPGQRHEGAVAEVGRIDDTAALSGKDETPILVGGTGP